MSRGNPTPAAKARRLNPIFFSTFGIICFSMSWVRFRKGLIKVWGSDKVFFHFFENIFEQANEGICRAESPFFCLFIGFRCGRLEKNSEIFKPSRGRIVTAL